jgi:prepilin-type N-terminal cleavage/methylation domain-containing protein
MEYRHHTKKGFTLAELLTVTGIIAVLVCIAVPVFLHSLEKARAATCQANMRSFLSSYTAEQLLAGNETDSEIIRLAAGRVSATASGYTVQGLCPDGGVVTVETYEDGSVKMSCSKHGGTSGAFAQSITSLIISKLTTLSRPDNSKEGQTLQKYLTGNHQIDSESPANVASSTESWTSILEKSMSDAKSPLLSQGWSIRYTGASKSYAVAVTTGGKESLTNAKDNDEVSVIQYVYDSQGNLLSQTEGTMKVKRLKVNNTTYNRLNMSTFQAAA